MIRAIIFKTFIYLFLFVFALVIFLPKNNLYYELETSLRKYSIVIDNEKVKEKQLWVELQDGNIYFLNKKYMKFEKIDLICLILFNRIKMSNVEFEKNAIENFNYIIDEANITYQVFNPFKIKIVAEGSFGSVDGYIDLNSNKLFIRLYASQEFKKSSGDILNSMKNNSGVYEYEYKL